MPNSIPMSWLYILTACIRVCNSFPFFANSLMSSMYIRWLIFSEDLQSLYSAVHFLSMWLSGIIVIINSNGDSASPLNIPLWILAKLFLLAVNYYYNHFALLRTSVSRWFSLEFERQQVSSSLQESSQYSDQSQQCSNLDGLHLPSYFQVSGFLPNLLGVVPTAPIKIGITLTLCYIATFMFWKDKYLNLTKELNSLVRSKYLSLFSPSFHFTLWYAGTPKSTIL